MGHTSESPRKVSAASATAITAIADCVSIISFRLSSASATTPASTEKTMIGTTRISPTRPSASAFRSEGTSRETCHRIAAVCIIDPENDASWPHQSSRKLRCWSATNGEERGGGAAACAAAASEDGGVVTEIGQST